jgi:hypothetical protein
MHLSWDFSRLPQSFMANATTMFNKMQSTRILGEVIRGLPLHVQLPTLDDPWQPLTLRISSQHSTVIIPLLRTLKGRQVKRADEVLVGKPEESMEDTGPPTTRSNSGEKHFGPLSKNGPDKNIYTKSERLSVAELGLGLKGLICTTDKQW